MLIMPNALSDELAVKIMDKVDSWKFWHALNCVERIKYSMYKGKRVMASQVYCPVCKKRFLVFFRGGSCG